MNGQKNTFDTNINEFYGQTECNLVVSNSNTIFNIKAGSIGLPVPGHIVDILDNDGNILNNNEYGNICIKYPDPVMFLNYWNLPEKTEKKFVTNKQDGSKWLITGDLGCKDDDGYFYYNSRDDDIINCKGYRIGPDQVEIPIESHEYIANCIAIGVIDDNIEVIKVFVTLSDIGKKNNDNIDLDKLRLELKELVRNSQGHYCVPKYIEFVDELAMTLTGKKQRNIHRESEKNKVNALNVK